MKKNDWKLFALVLAAACLLGILLYGKPSKGKLVVVEVDGEEYGRYALDEDQTVGIGETNRLEIRDGQAQMVWADCPDQICVHTSPADSVHDTIVCLPNKVIVEVVEE